MATRTFALLTAVALIALTASPAAARADGHASIRYASIKSCGGPDETRPCGDWRLVLHSGKQTVLRDAQGVALDAKGRSVRHTPAAIAVSGDGRRVAYFTKSGRLAVRTLGGGVKLLAGNALPRVAQNEVTLRLSDDGGRLAAVIGGERPAATRIFDTVTGARLGTIPATATVTGFSGDGDEVLTSVAADESVMDLVVYSDAGRQLLRGTPPQVIATNAPVALAADGRTVASVVRGDRPELVTYDLESDQIVDRKELKLPAGEIHMIDWTADTEVTLHLTRFASRSTRMTIVQIDTGTGKVKVRDRYTLMPDTFVFAACGG